MVSHSPKIMTEEELELLLKAVPKVVWPEYVFYWRNLLYCASEAGLRMSEAVELKKDDLILDSHGRMKLLLRKQKNRVVNEFVVPTQFLAARLLKHCEVYERKINEKDGYLFFSRFVDNKHLSTVSGRKFMCKLVDVAGLDDVYAERKWRKKSSIGSLRRISFHTLRHLYGQRIASGDNPQPLHVVQMMLRHKAIQSTMRYIHQSIHLKQKVVDDIFDRPPQKIALDDVKLLVEAIGTLAKEVKSIKERS